MVRATRSILSWLRAVRPIESKAVRIKTCPARSSSQNSRIAFVSISALHFGPPGPKRSRWISRALSTLALMKTECSSGERDRSSGYSTEGTLMRRSILSSRGPEILDI